MVHFINITNPIVATESRYFDFGKKLQIRFSIIYYNSIVSLLTFIIRKVSEVADFLINICLSYDMCAFLTYFKASLYFQSNIILNC